MKTIELDDDLYQFIASKTERIGESASDILRRLVGLDQKTVTGSSSSAPLELTHNSTASLFHIDSEELGRQKGAVGRFIYVLSELHNYSPERFADVLSITGRNRIYFATSKADLLAAGSSTVPRAIPNSPYWVVTNTNTGKKRAMLKRVAAIMGLDDVAVQAVLKCLPNVAYAKPTKSTKISS
jgi:negative modulator of initiation of replication